MSTNPTAAPISALHEILQWSATRPDWQRDALRRIVTLEALSDADIKELNRLCRAKHNADKSATGFIVAVPLALEHLPPAPGAESSVTLLSIGKLQRVNRLPSDEVLTFGDSGLTVIYGENGSGKSGYGRVIKKACRTRGTPSPIRSNAYAPTTTQPASAEIMCRIAGSSPTIAWTDGSTPDGRLANVFVFDAFTAGNYLQEDGPAAFTPRGLDVLPKLSKACDAVSALIQRDIDAHRADIAATAKNWKYTATTAVGKLIAGLSAATKPAELKALAVLTQEQAQRLADLNETLKSDPKQKAKESRASAARLRGFAAKVAVIARDLSDAQALILNSLIEETVTATATAKSFAAGQFDATHLSGTGSDIWRKLWEAARSFATTEAYPNLAFPVIADDARCVLCQQTLDAQGTTRLQAFDAFCKDQSQQLAAAAAKRLTDAAEKIKLLEALATTFIQVEADLATVTADQKVALGAYVTAADARLTAINASLRTKTWTNPVALPPSIETSITKLATMLDARAAMEESADDPVARAALTTERDGLAAREWLSTVPRLEDSS